MHFAHPRFGAILAGEEVGEADWYRPRGAAALK